MKENNIRFKVEYEAIINGEKIKGVEDECSYFLVDQVGKMYSYSPMMPILPIEKEYTKCRPLFKVGDEYIPFDDIEKRCILVKKFKEKGYL